MSELPTSDLLVQCVRRWLAFRHYFELAERLDGHEVPWKAITAVTGIRKKEFEKGDLLAWRHGASTCAWEGGPSTKRKRPSSTPSRAKN